MYMCVLIIYHACTIVKCMFYGHCHSNHHGDWYIQLVGSLDRHSTSDR